MKSSQWSKWLLPFSPTKKDLSASVLLTSDTSSRTTAHHSAQSRRHRGLFGFSSKQVPGITLPITHYGPTYPYRDDAVSTVSTTAGVMPANSSYWTHHHHHHYGHSPKASKAGLCDDSDSELTTTTILYHPPRPPSPPTSERLYTPHSFSVSSSYPGSWLDHPVEPDSFEYDVRYNYRLAPAKTPPDKTGKCACKMRRPRSGSTPAAPTTEFWNPSGSKSELTGSLTPLQSPPFSLSSKHPKQSAKLSPRLRRSRRVEPVYPPWTQHQSSGSTMPHNIPQNAISRMPVIPARGASHLAQMRPTAAPLRRPSSTKTATTAPYNPPIVSEALALNTTKMDEERQITRISPTTHAKEQGVEEAKPGLRVISCAVPASATPLTPNVLITPYDGLANLLDNLTEALEKLARNGMAQVVAIASPSLPSFERFPEPLEEPAPETDMTKIKSFDRNSKAAASNLAACPPLSLVVNSTVGRSSEASPTATTPVSPIPSGIPAALQKLDYVPKTTYIPASAKDRSQKFKEPLPSSFAAKKNQQQPQQDKTMVFYDKPLLQPLTTDSFLDDSRSQLALVPAVNSETESNPPPFALLFPLPPSFMRPPIMGRSYSAPENASPPSPLEKEIKKDSPQTPLLSPGLDTPILGREDWSWKQQGMNEKRCSLPIEPKTTTITSTMSTSQAMIMAAMAKAIREGTLRLDLAQVPVDTDGTKGSNDCQGGRRRSRSLQKDFGRRGCLGHCPSIGLTAHSLPRTYGYF